MSCSMRAVSLLLAVSLMVDPSMSSVFDQEALALVATHHRGLGAARRDEAEREMVVSRAGSPLDLTRRGFFQRSFAAFGTAAILAQTSQTPSGAIVSSEDAILINQAVSAARIALKHIQT